jgi:large subunit ribosomal protein L15
MQIHNVQPITKNKKTMIVGRGGKRGKTSGRGTKGQNARAGHKNRPEMRDFIKRIPKLRGRGVSPFKSYAIKPWEVTLTEIEKAFKTGGAVNPKALYDNKVVQLVGGDIPKVKILATGEITKKIAVTGCLFSAGAKVAIEKAGGTVVADAPKKA